MKSALISPFLGAILALSAVASADDWSVNGRVVDESGSPIANAVVSTNGENHRVDASGGFHLDVQAGELAALYIEAEGYYRFVHTFHRSDVLPANSHELDIELVAMAPQRRLLLFAGDSMLARRYFEPRPGEPALVRKGNEFEDGKKLLGAIRPYVQLADYASVNVETQLSDKPLRERLPKSVTFYSPPELASILEWAGFDYAALGNNHTWDYQEEGLTRTFAALQAAGLDYSGAGLDEVTARKAQAVELGNQPYRYLSYVGWAGLFSPTQTAKGAKGGAALGGSKVFREDLQIVDPGTVAVLQYHSGIEYAEAPAISERMRLREAVDNGADVAIGHHPHVLQGFEIYKDRLIAYSMGNFLFDQYHYTTQLGMLVYVWMDGDSLHRAEVVPMNINGYQPTPATGRFRASVLGRLARLSRPHGTCLRRNGAHAIIESCTDSLLADLQIVDIGDVDPKKVPVHLESMGLTTMSPAIFKAGDHAYRLGTDILPRGDFDSAGLHGTHDRTWLQGEGITLADGESRVLQVDVPPGGAVRTGMKVFERVFSVSNPTTVGGRIRSDGDVVVQFWLQRRRTDDELDDALQNGPSKLVGRLRVPAGSWRAFSFDFDQPRVSTRSVRLLIDVHDESDNTDGARISLDDLAWIEWRTPWLEGDARPLDATFATHVQLQPK